jgi:hypothetical protein
VSPYRLAAHLTSAFAIYAGLAWTTLSLAQPQPLLASAGEVARKATATLRGRVLPLGALVAVTAVSGAFVAGLDAGRWAPVLPLVLPPPGLRALSGWQAGLRPHPVAPPNAAPPPPRTHTHSQTPPPNARRAFNTFPLMSGRLVPEE